MTRDEPHPPKTSSSCTVGNCLEVGRDGPFVRITSTWDPGVAYATTDEWRAFLAGVRNGEFDLEELP